MLKKVQMVDLTERFPSKKPATVNVEEIESAIPVFSMYYTGDLTFVRFKSGNEMYIAGTVDQLLGAE